jgi:hypothetical protein
MTNPVGSGVSDEAEHADVQMCWNFLQNGWLEEVCLSLLRDISLENSAGQTKSLQ